MTKYGDLTAFLENQPADEPVSLNMAELEEIVGTLPPSSSGRAWWANTEGHSQALAWLQAGRRVTEIRLGESVVFSPVGVVITGRVAGTDKAQPVMDGVGALAQLAERAGYRSVLALVAENTLFLHPDTVKQTGGEPLFPVIRDPMRRGELATLPDGSRVQLDDNTTPTLAFLWSAGRSKGADVQYNHLWGDPRNRHTYTALWNLAVTPAFLAKTTDGSNHREVLEGIRYRSWELYGYLPVGEEAPKRPAGYEGLVWPPHPEPVTDLAGVLRARMNGAPKSRPAIAAREIGWLFSGWEPDKEVTHPHPD